MNFHSIERMYTKGMKVKENEKKPKVFFNN